LTEPNHPKPLQKQGLFISSVTPISQEISLQYLAPSPSTQPDDKTNKEFRQSTNNPRRTKAIPNISSPYFYPYFLNAFTNYFAPYRHHGCHWFV
jgi:hypothetical protein